VLSTLIVTVIKVMAVKLDLVSDINTQNESVTMAADFVLCLHRIAAKA